MLQHGWNLKTLCWVKEASHIRPHILSLHFHEMSRIGKFIDTESSDCLGLAAEKKMMNWEEWGLPMVMGFLIWGDEDVLKL